MRVLLAAALLFFNGLAGATAWASESVVSIKAVQPPEPLVPGKPATLDVEITVTKPYHINSNHPLEEYLIPTSLELESKPGVRFGRIVFPQAHVRKLSFSDKPMAVFEGVVVATVEMIPLAELKTEEIDVRGELRYQACNDIACLPPARAAFNVKLPVARPGGSALTREPSSVIQETSQRPEEAVAGAGKPLSPFENESLFVTFLLVFAGGLALNLTPCVYPMIPITITYFGGQAQGRRGSIVVHSMLYTVGMAVTYSVLGVIAAMTGGLLGSALRYPPVLVGVSAVMVLLALSMFDVYEFRMPGVLNRLAGKSRKGFAGTFLMGLTVGIVAAPCIGPFVFGLLTYVGDRGNIVLGFLLFFVLAIGLGLPFLVLGIFSGSIRRLPRSGAWMVWVRRVFGFILLAMAVFFLKTLFPTQLAYRLTFSTVMFLAGIYLAWIEPTATGSRFFPVLRNIVGVGFFAIAVIGAAAGLQEQIAGTVLSQAGPAGNVLAADNERSIQWHPYSEEMLTLASSRTSPVLIDFYAEWCAPCKELDKHTFTSPGIVDLSKEFVMLKVDLTSAGDPETEALRRKYRTRGVPTLVFLKPDGEEMQDLRVTGFEPKEMFLARMKRALLRSRRQAVDRQ